MRRYSSGLVLAVVLAVSTTACELPYRKPPDVPSKVAADRGEIATIYDRYSKVRASALTLLDPNPLTTVEAGPVLAIDAGALQVAKRLSRSSVPPTDQGLAVEQVLAPRVSRYPLWFVAVARDSVRRLRKVQIFERESAVAQWELVASPETLLSTKLPRFGRAGDGALEPVSPRAGTSLVASPQAAMDAYAATLDNRASADADAVVQDSFIQQMRAVAAASASIKGVTFVQKWGAKPVEFAVRTADGGALVFATLLRQDGYSLAKGVAIDWPEGSEQAAFLSNKLYSAGLLRYYHQVLMYVPPSGEGKPRVLGQYGGVVSGSGS